MLEHDPWKESSPINIYVIKSEDIKGLPQPVDEIRMASLLALGESIYVVLQLSDHFWSIPLRNPDRASRILDPEVRRMKSRFTVRGIEDTGHIYCLCQKGMRDEVVGIEINSEDATDKLKVESIFESPNSKLINLAVDPESK